MSNDDVSNEKVQIIQQEEEEEMVQLAYEAKVGLLQNKAAKGILDYSLTHSLTYSLSLSLSLSLILLYLAMNKNVVNNKEIAEMAAEAEELTKSILPNYDDENEEEEETVNSITPLTILFTYSLLLTHSFTITHSLTHSHSFIH